MLQRIGIIDQLNIDGPQLIHIFVFFSPEWILQPDPLQLAQIITGSGSRDEHKHLDRIYEKQICS